ncbi:DUF6273 domain-containing protein, partial [Adlercreutzia murintestinalis]|uniref:DUF6273 domain-containing protein n=1 Tax=Adlercreutzia murintestinalis TaxID=2941325 RepID=UPI00203ECFDB
NALYPLRIIGLNQDQAFRNNVPDGQLGLTFQFKECITSAEYGAWEVLSQGWGASFLRLRLHADGDIYGAFPETIKKAIEPAVKSYSANNSTSINVDLMFLPSLKELLGSSYDSLNELNLGQPDSAVSLLGNEGTGVSRKDGYLFYESRTSKADLKNALSNGQQWWLRSVWFKSNGVEAQGVPNIVIVADGGWPGGAGPTAEKGVLPCFCM